MQFLHICSFSSYTTRQAPLSNDQPYTCLGATAYCLTWAVTEVLVDIFLSSKYTGGGGGSVMVRSE
jgi:hypothetical protein